MRVLFLTASGHAYSDKVGLNFDNIQEPDGIHPLSKDAVFKDLRRSDAITFITAKTTMPIGENHKLVRMREIMFERTLMIVARRGQKVSRIWSRRSKGIAIGLARSVFCGWGIGVIILGVYIVVRLVMA